MEGYQLAVWYVLTGLIGLCTGSFLNVVIYRVPRGIGLARPSSHCPTCGYTLKWYDNIPVLSYILLRGKCRACKAHISFRYTLTELSNMLLWLLCAALFLKKSIPYALIGMAISSVFLCIFFIDLEHMLIFDRFQLLFFGLSVAALFFEKQATFGKDMGLFLTRGIFGKTMNGKFCPTIFSHPIGAAVAAALFVGVAAGFKRFLKKDALGGGDIKLAVTSGLLLGWEKFLFAILLSSVSASVALGILRRKRGDRDREYPFAPFITAGVLVAFFFGAPVLGAYFGIFAC